MRDTELLLLSASCAVQKRFVDLIDVKHLSNERTPRMPKNMMLE